MYDDVAADRGELHVAFSDRLRDLNIYITADRIGIRQAENILYLYPAANALCLYLSCDRGNADISAD